MAVYALSRQCLRTYIIWWPGDSFENTAKVGKSHSLREKRRLCTW